jgi:hypothetical protein
MNYLSQQIPLGKHSFKSAALALSAKGIRSTTHGTDLMVAPELASVARKILDESEPSDPFNQPRHSPSGNCAGDDEQPDNDQIRKLEDRIAALEDENRDLRERLRTGKRRETERQPDEQERERKSAAALAQTIRSRAAAMGCSVGDLCDQLKLNASDIRRFGFDDGDMLPTQFARAAGLLPRRDESAIQFNDDGSASCSLMSPGQAKEFLEGRNQ